MQVSQRNFHNGYWVLTAFCLFMIMLIVPTGGAVAAESNSIRIGGDYKFIDMREGATARDCSVKCRNDVSCKAWTFIKERVKKREGLQFNLGPDLNIGFGGKREVTPAQCRLKHSVGPRRANSCCTSGVRQVARRGKSKAERCADYAESALWQQDRNLTQRCGFRGNRWNGNYRLHYRWCMDQRRARTTERETKVRDDDLRECRRGGRDRDRRCDRYANTAMDILEKAKDNNCGIRTRDWDKRYERVYEWCLDARRSKRTQAMDAAQAKLASCIRRGGGERVERCEAYADGALAQIKKGQDNQCGFRGGIWANSYKAQYRFCSKNNRRMLRRRNASRRTALDRCTRRRSENRAVEVGRIQVNQRNSRQWHNVKFEKRFKNPVVIMGPVSFNGRQPAHARVRNVTRRGFQFRIEEFGEDGRHVRETLSYMIVERGIHRFEDMVIEAGSIVTGANLVRRDWARTRLTHRWRRAPTVLAQVQTDKGNDAVSARVKNVSTRDFDVSLSEQERNRRGHPPERIGYVAIQYGVHRIEGGGDDDDDDARLFSRSLVRMNDRWTGFKFPYRYSDTPALFARAQSSNENDTFDIRYRRLTNRSVEFRLQEDTSKDRETGHRREALGVIMLPYGSYWSRSTTPVSAQRDRGGRRPAPVVDDGGIIHGVASCRDYADKSTEQYAKSKDLFCRFVGATWHSNVRRHRRYCRLNGLRRSKRAFIDRADQLEQCSTREMKVREEWVSLGCVKASRKRRSNSIAIGRDKGRFTALRLQGSRGKARIYSASVTFGNGRSKDMGIAAGIRRGQATEPYKFRGSRGRFVSKVSLVQRSRGGPFGGKAIVCVYGKK